MARAVYLLRGAASSQLFFVADFMTVPVMAETTGNCEGLERISPAGEAVEGGGLHFKPGGERVPTSPRRQHRGERRPPRSSSNEAGLGSVISRVSTVARVIEKNRASSSWRGICLRSCDLFRNLWPVWPSRRLEAEF